MNHTIFLHWYLLPTWNYFWPKFCYAPIVLWTSTKFVQRCVSVSKVKQKLNILINVPVEIFKKRYILNHVLENLVIMAYITRLYRSVLDYLGLYKTIQDYIGLFRTIHDYIRLQRTPQDYTRLYRTIQDCIRLYKTI